MKKVSRDKYYFTWRKTEALQREEGFHNKKAEDLLQGIIDYLKQNPDNQIVVLPRDILQYNQIRNIYDGSLLMPAEPVDCLSLLSYSDAVFSGGGTVNREAATLGVPVYSFFQGPIGTVDRYLAKEGKLIFIENMEEIQRVSVNKRSRVESVKNIQNALHEVLKIIKDTI